MKKLIIIFIFFLGITITSKAQEERYYALFIIKFCEGISFSGETITIAVCGSDQVVAELQKIAEVKPKYKIVKASHPDDASGSNVLFISEERSNQFEKFKSLAQTGTVIITEADGYVEKGANICFVKSNGKLRYRVQQSQFDKQGLKVSTGILTLAM